MLVKMLDIGAGDLLQTEDGSKVGPLMIDDLAQTHGHPETGLPAKKKDPGVSR